jgi:tetratricopeptide (TPR) repeat protein
LYTAHLILGALYSATGEHDKAIDRFRRVLAIEPNHVAALNDLAYALAVHRPDAVKEALALAQKAFTLAMGNPLIVDPLAWVLHRSGEATEARRVIAAACAERRTTRRFSSTRPSSMLPPAPTKSRHVNLARALELDPTLEQHSDVQQLRLTLGRAEKQKP